MHYRVMQGLQQNINNIKGCAQESGLILLSTDYDLVNSGYIDIRIISCNSNIQYFCQCLTNMGFALVGSYIIDLGNGVYRIEIGGYISY
jgi:hypothetical protein